ncbi:MAG: amidohydrolase family protein [Clostridia bacterium]
MFLIKNGKVLTMTGKLYDGADILIENGVIKAIGGNLDTGGERSTRIIDATNFFIMPGLIDAHSHLGIKSAHSNDAVTASQRASNDIKFLAPDFSEALKAGVTQTLIMPRYDNLVSGMCALCKTNTNADDMFLNDSAAMKATLSGAQEGEMNESKRMALTALLRDELFSAKEYLNAKERAKQNDLPFTRSESMESWEGVLTRKIPLIIEARFREDVETAVRMKKLLNIDIVICGCDRAEPAFEEVAENHIPVVYTGDFSSGGLDKLSMLEKIGVEFAISANSPNSPIAYLPFYAGLAAKSGISLFAALKSVTTAPAKILGSISRTATIEVGKDADIAIFDDNPLEVFSNVIATIVDGDICYER